MIIFVMLELCIMLGLYLIFIKGFRNHKLHNPLEEPGSADLTADVDFSYLRENIKDKLISFGPVNQCDFLKQLQIEIRLQVRIFKELNCNCMLIYLCCVNKVFFL